MPTETANTQLLFPVTQTELSQRKKAIAASGMPDDVLVSYFVAATSGSVGQLVAAPAAETN